MSALQSLATSLFDREVHAYRTLGVADHDIALKLKVDPKVVESVPPPRPSAPRSRAVQHQQLMQMAQALMPKVAEGDRDAIATMLKVMQREASLLGLDAPKEVINRNFNTLEDPPVSQLPTSELLRMIAESRTDTITVEQGDGQA